MLRHITRRHFSLNNGKAFRPSSLTSYINQYQSNGYKIAQNIDPLGLSNPVQTACENTKAAFEPDFWGLSESEWAQTIKQRDASITNSMESKCGSVHELRDYLKRTYTQNVCVEFSHVQDPMERQWLYDNFERYMNDDTTESAPARVTESERIKALQLLIRVEEMEHFIHKKFATHKRYSSEGSESLIVALNALIAEASKEDKEIGNEGIENVVIGMPHRGRLATLVVLNDFPMRNLLHKIAGNCEISDELVDRIDDIPTHIAVSNTNKFSTSTGSAKSGHKRVTVTMIHNPSHLESQNAITMGKTRAKLNDYTSNDTCQVLNIQAHGDAAFCGQGAAYESLTLSNLPKFSIGGSIHIITNNQVGFTTQGDDGRSTQYSSDIVKSFGIPIIRVNGSDGGSTAETVVRVSKFMIKYWKTFKKDILVDMIGFRKHGHNEVDEPSFTQPSMYQKIRSMQSTFPESYAKELIDQGVITEEQIQSIRTEVRNHFENEYQASLSFKPKLKDTMNEKYKGSRAFTHKWQGMTFSQFGDPALDQATGFDTSILKDISLKSVQLPEEFTCHPRLEKMHITNRRANIDKGVVDWATAEIMALVSLNLQGFNTRLVGEDSERGTFSQRHVVFHDQKNLGRKYNPLAEQINRGPGIGRLEVLNTNLSEVATMAYEYGYSLESPKNLCLWEAQFGDFYNPSQMIVDQYIMCSELKWLRQSGFVLLLPHGFDGAGPEHSTCHIERFLQNINSNIYDPSKLDAHRDLNSLNINFQVAQPTMPANYFHLLRRQMMRDYRKPLIIAAPKIGLKHPLAVSPIQEFEVGGSFQPVLEQFYEAKATNTEDQIVVFCSGKIGFDLHQTLKENAEGLAANVHLIKIEELAPFPTEMVTNLLMAGHHQGYRTRSFTWIQEEPVNQGAFAFSKLHIDRILKHDLRLPDCELQFIGRPSMHSFCSGSPQDHKAQAKDINEKIQRLILDS